MSDNQCQECQRLREIVSQLTRQKTSYLEVLTTIAESLRNAMGLNKPEWESLALDALLASALRQEDADPKLLPPLTDVEKAVVAALGRSFITQLLAGKRL